MMTILPLVFLSLLSGSALSCYCDNCCWQRCFNTPGAYGPEYAKFHSLITTLIAQKETLGTGGTAFLFDQTTEDPDICLFQKNVASLIALTMPVSDVCNPFFFNRYATNFAYYVHSWQCKERCEAATTISNTHECGPAPASVSNWVNGGCILAKHAFNYPGLPCSKNTVDGREMVVALANSKFHYLSGFPPSYWSYCMGFTRAIVGVEDANVAQMNNFASNNLLAFDWKSMDTSRNLQAIRQLLKCINVNCCNSSANTPVKRQAEGGKVTVLALGEKEPQTITEEEFSSWTPPTLATKAPVPQSCGQDKRCGKKGGKCYETKCPKNISPLYCTYLGRCKLRNRKCKYCLKYCPDCGGK